MEKKLKKMISLIIIILILINYNSYVVMAITDEIIDLKNNTIENNSSTENETSNIEPNNTNTVENDTEFENIIVNQTND